MSDYRIVTSVARGSDASPGESPRGDNASSTVVPSVCTGLNAARTRAVQGTLVRVSD